MNLNSNDLEIFESINEEILSSYSDLNSVLSHYVTIFLIIILFVLLFHILSVSIMYLWFYNYSDIFDRLNISKLNIFFDLLIPFLVYRYFFKLYYDLKPSILKRFIINFLIVILLFFSLFNIIFLFILYFYIIYLFYFVLKKYTLNKNFMILYILSLGLGFLAIIFYDMYYRYKLTH